jgi:archaellum biogenesis protein FlaJ (TadC family)
MIDPKSIDSKIEKGKPEIKDETERLAEKKSQEQKQDAKKDFSFNLPRPVIIGATIVGLIASILMFLFSGYSLLNGLFGLVLGFVGTIVYYYVSKILKKIERLRKMEEVFPDFLQLMSSNLRAGMTIDRAITLSAREELDPLDKEIIKVGREIATGKNIESALLEMSRRIGSPKIDKIILLILSGIKAGGNVATILEETSANMRGRNFVEKRAASNVLMYVIFIFIAVAAGAPLLFGLSSILVEVLKNILGGIPDMSGVSASMPFTFKNVDISINFIKYFSIFFIIVTDFLAALILGLVNKGNEKEGLRYFPPLAIISLITFFAVRFLLGGFVKSFFGG